MVSSRPRSTPTRSFARASWATSATGSRIIGFAAEPDVVPGTAKADFDFTGSDYLILGWSPEGKVHFSYAVAVTPDGLGFTVDSAADLDGNGILQMWGYVKPTQSGVTVDGVWGCVAAAITPMEISACHANPQIF